MNHWYVCFSIQRDTVALPESSEEFGLDARAISQLQGTRMTLALLWNATTRCCLAKQIPPLSNGCAHEDVRGQCFLPVP